MRPAIARSWRTDSTRLMSVDDRGLISHHRRTDLPSLLRPGDLLIANDAATLPASLRGVHAPTGREIELRLAGRRSLHPGAVTQFTVLAFGAGDFRTPTEQRPAPPPLRAGEELRIGPLRAFVTAASGHQRLVDIEFGHPPEAVWEGIARHGRPIQYSYVPEPLAIWDTWTSIASRPAAFEPPSAGFILDWAMLSALRKRRVQFATLTHAAGISSTGDDELDRRLPFDEPYVIPASTARLVNQGVHAGGRIVAVGTTVVRALESAADAGGCVRAGHGIATGRIGPGTRLTIVDGLVSGMHERGTSHYELLRAFQSDDTLERMIAEAEGLDYRVHEFGDAAFIARVERRGSAVRRDGHVAAGRVRLEAEGRRHTPRNASHGTAINR